MEQELNRKAAKALAKQKCSMSFHGAASTNAYQQKQRKAKKVRVRMQKHAAIKSTMAYTERKENNGGNRKVFWSVCLVFHAGILIGMVTPVHDGLDHPVA